MEEDNFTEIFLANKNATTRDARESNNDISLAKEGKHWFFTDWVHLWDNDKYKNLSSCDKGDKLFNDLVELGCSRIEFQTEICPTTGKEHFQGVFSLLKKKRQNYLIKNIFENRKNHLRLQYSKGGVKYCSKTETRKGNEQWSYPKKHYEITTIEKFKDWQTEIIETLNKPPMKRMIHWYWSEEGKIGKSTFVTYLYDHRGGDEGAVAVYDSMKKSDVYFSFAGGKRPPANYKAPSIVIFDLPRARVEIDITTIEGLLNGLIFCGKYESKGFRFQPPHIIVFANREPNTNSMSIDRWIIKNIDEKNNDNKDEVPIYTFDMINTDTDVIDEDILKYTIDAQGE